MAARVCFVVEREFAYPAAQVFAELTDWQSHAQWVPATTVDLVAGDGGPGTEFIATSGLGPAALPDRMRVEALDPAGMSVDIVKLGPVLTGTVRLDVISLGDDRCRLKWREDVEVPRVPAVLAGFLAGGSRMAFRHALGRLDRRLGRAA